MRKIIHFGSMDVSSTSSVKAETPVCNRTARSEGGAMVIDAEGNVFTYDGEGKLEKAEYKNGTAIDFTDSGDDSATELAKELINSFTGLELYDVLEYLEEYGMVWEDIKPIICLFTTEPPSTTRELATLNLAIGSHSTRCFQPERVNYTTLLALMKAAIYNTLQRSADNA